MFDRLQAVEDRYDRLNELLSDPSIVNDLNKLREYSKEQSDIQDTVLAYREYKVVQVQLKDAKEMLNEKIDPEMRDMVKEELSELEDQVEEIEARLKILLIPTLYLNIRLTVLKQYMYFLMDSIYMLQS